MYNVKKFKIDVENPVKIMSRLLHFWIFCTIWGRIVDCPIKPAFDPFGPKIPCHCLKIPEDACFWASVVNFVLRKTLILLCLCAIILGLLTFLFFCDKLEFVLDLIGEESDIKNGTKRNKLKRKDKKQKKSAISNEKQEHKTDNLGTKDKSYGETSASNKKEYYKINNLFKIFNDGGCKASKEIQEGTLLFREQNEFIPWSKFKHSCCQGQCCANSEFVTLEKGQLHELSIFEIRAISTIVHGEELSLNRAGGDIFMKNLTFRREYLKEKIDLDCHCDRCEIEEREGDKNRYELYENMIIQAKKLHQNRILNSPDFYEKGLQTWRQEIACYKEMYRFAQECQADRRLIVERIISPGITATIEAYEYAEQNPGNLDLMIEFKNDCFVFIKRGEKLTETFAGKGPNNLYWKLINAGKIQAEEKFATIDEKLY